MTKEINERKYKTEVRSAKKEKYSRLVNLLLIKQNQISELRSVVDELANKNENLQEELVKIFEVSDVLIIE